MAKVMFTGTAWKTKTVPLMERPDFDDEPDISDREKRSAVETFERLSPIELEVVRVPRPKRQAWDRGFAKIIANDVATKKEGSALALHPDTIDALHRFHEEVLSEGLVRVLNLEVGEVDVSTLPQPEAVEMLAECDLLGYASKAIRSAQAPTVEQGNG